MLEAINDGALIAPGLPLVIRALRVYMRHGVGFIQPQRFSLSVISPVFTVWFAGVKGASARAKGASKEVLEGRLLYGV